MKILTEIIISIVVVGVLAYFSLLALLSLVLGSCGLNFQALMTSPIQITEDSERFNLSEGGELIVTNRNDTLSPILTLIEKGKIQWTLDTDVSNSSGYERYRIWKISNVTITNDTDPIKLNFIGHWTFGAEVGSMEINRKSGENKFCLSW